MHKYIGIILLALAAMLPLVNCQAKTLYFVAENLPPFHYLDANNKPTGALVEVIQALDLPSSIKRSIKLVPFARAYKQVLEREDVFMISLLRNPTRESKFNWIGQTYKTRAFLVGLKDRKDIKLHKLDEAKSYIVGTIRGYYSEKFLKQSGFKVDQNLLLSVKYNRMWKLLFKGRVDLVLTNYLALDRELQSIGLDRNNIKPYFEVTDFPNELFIATNFITSTQTTELLTNALKKLKYDGRYQQIMDNWQL